MKVHVGLAPPRVITAKDRHRVRPRPDDNHRIYIPFSPEKTLELPSRCNVWTELRLSAKD